MKKLIALGVTAFAFTMTFGVASANYYPFGGSTPTLTVNSTNISSVNNNVKTTSNTGKNTTGGFFFGGTISTGDATSVADVSTAAGSNKTIVGGNTKGKTTVNNTNFAGVTNTVMTASNTGGNKSTTGSIKTGDAGSGATVTTMLGSSVTVIK